MLDENDFPHNQWGDRHMIWVTNDMRHNQRAGRHTIWGGNDLTFDVPAHTGRDVSPRFSCYPHQIPNGMLDENDVRHNQRAGRHTIWVTNDVRHNQCAGRHMIWVTNNMQDYQCAGRHMIWVTNDMWHNQHASRHTVWVTNEMRHNQRAGRHTIWGGNDLTFDVPSHTGRDMSPRFSCYSMSIKVKVAKYKGKTRVHLVENNEYGYCSIIKATKQVLDKIDLENKTKSRITSKERIDTRLWNAIAIREAIINAIVHNDYSHEVPPKFEIFDDRIEITSAGGLPELLSQEEFFEGFSIPRNQEMMRIFKDLELVEHLGSGVPRILQAYPRQCFNFTENFLRMTFPNAWDLSIDEDTPQVTTQVTTQVEAPVEAQAEAQVEAQVEIDILMALAISKLSSSEITSVLGHKNLSGNIKKTLVRLLNNGYIERSIPDKPKSPNQKYRLTEKGKILQEQLKK